MKTKLIIFFILLLAIYNAYAEDYEITDINIFKNTPVWKIAIAINEQDSSSIKKEFNKNPQLLNFQEPKYGTTLLLWSIGMEKHESAKALLECGANPNIVSYCDGSPLFIASDYSWVDTYAKKDPKYVILLLKHGADPNINHKGNKVPGKCNNIIEVGESPLMKSIPCGLEKTKALVEAGADINHKTKSGRTAAIIALFAREFPEYAYYLIVEKKAKVYEPYTRGEIFSFGKYDPNELFYPVGILRDWVFDLNSREYKMKMKIVEEFTKQGVIYREARIDKATMEHIKKLYPNNWEEYIKKY